MKKKKNKSVVENEKDINSFYVNEFYILLL